VEVVRNLDEDFNEVLCSIHINLIATLEPAFTAVWAYFLLSEILTSTQLIGGTLVLMGVILLRFGDR
jgi:drug/metabolite transporter (DMT)-like permease